MVAEEEYEPAGQGVQEDDATAVEMYPFGQGAQDVHPWLLL